MLAEFNALYPHRRHMTAKLRVFLDMLVERFAEERVVASLNAAEDDRPRG